VNATRRAPSVARRWLGRGAIVVAVGACAALALVVARSLQAPSIPLSTEVVAPPPTPMGAARSGSAGQPPVAVPAPAPAPPTERAAPPPAPTAKVADLSEADPASRATGAAHGTRRNVTARTHSPAVPNAR